MLYGVSYYHEYQPLERLDEDIRLMHEAGLSVVRLGESTWSNWEPEDGIFELAWMDRVVNALYDAGIKVVFGTPTYAIPPWLHAKHPEVMAQHQYGTKAWYGARQNMNITDPTYLFYAERIIRQLMGHFAPHPAIIGFQVDNETSSGALYNPNVFKRFVSYLKNKFGTVDYVNEIWGLAYWSQRLSSWDELWTPDGNTNTGYAIEWRRFQTSLVTEFLIWQKDIVREYARPDQFVTQNVVGGHNRPESDRYRIAQAMDILAINPYHPTQDTLQLPQSGQRAGLPQWTEQSKSEIAAGPWMIYENGQFGYSGQQSNFLITEVNASSIGDSHTNYPSYDGQWRLVTYAYISQGANMLAYWHWHTLHYGQETYWGGVLNHDLEPGRCYAEVQQIAHELMQHNDLLTDLTIKADVAFLYSQDSKYALEIQPCLQLAASDQPNYRSYQAIFDTFYGAFVDARAQTSVIYPEQDLSQFKLIVIPALYIADDALLKRLVEYVNNGGHLLLTFRSGCADEFNRVRAVRAPGVLREVVGASYQEYSNLMEPLELSAAAADFELPADARARRWADGLLLEGASPLAYYKHPHFGRFPAIVSKSIGKGRVTYCGTLPNASLGKVLAAWTLKQAGIATPGSHFPDSVLTHTAYARTGQQLLFLTNWSWTPCIVEKVPLTGHELFSGELVTADSRLELGAWDVKVVVGP